MPDKPKPFRAFPSVAISDESGGMSLAEYYAGQALVALLNRSVEINSTTIVSITSDAANFGVALADEMASRRPHL